MSERKFGKRLQKQILFALICVVIIFAQILPLATEPKSWAGPDLMFAFIYAWVIRRPDLVPTFLATALLLLSDVMFYRPIGLWTLLVVIVIVRLKVRHDTQAKPIFPMEFLSFAGTLVLLHLVYRFVLGIVFVENAPVFLALTQIISTLIAYPVVVVLSNYVFGIRPLEPRERDSIRGFV